MEEPDIERWSVPFYLDFLHGNFLRTQDLYSVASPHPRSWEQWRDLLCRELREVTPEIAGDLMTDANWRAQICGAFFCGLKRWDEFTLDIGRRLVAKRNGFSTQGYAFALARMPSHAAANYLCGYLSRVGRPEDTTGWYDADVEWVLASLQWIDEHPPRRTLHREVSSVLAKTTVSKLREKGSRSAFDGVATTRLGKRSRARVDATGKRIFFLLSAR